MPKIVPIKDLRDTTKISELCHATDEPIYVTKNGYGDMVIISMEVYDKLIARNRIHDEILEGKEQADKNDLLEGDTAMEALREKYGRAL